MLKLDTHLKCKCGSHHVLFVVQKGKTKQVEAYCEKCVQEYEKTTGKPSIEKDE